MNSKEKAPAAWPGPGITRSGEKPSVLVADLHLDAARLCELLLGEHNLENPIFELSFYLLGIDAIRQGENPKDTDAV